MRLGKPIPVGWGMSVPDATNSAYAGGAEINPAQ